MSLSKKTNKFLPLVTKTGHKVIKRLWWMLLVSMLLIGVDKSYLHSQCKNTTESKSWQCNLSNFSDDLGWNLLQIFLTILFIDIGLKRDTLEEIQEIFQSSQATKHIKQFFPKREEYRRLIEDNFKNIRPDQEIKLLFLYEDISLFQAENLNVIRDKVINGCRIKIFIIHPDSSLLPCLEQAGFPPNLGKSSLSNLATKLELLANNLERCRSTSTKKSPIKGSLEVRLHKDLFSPIGYYSDSRDLELLWMYLSNSNDGHEYPAFHMSNLEMIKKAKEHFDHLWDKSVGDDILLKVTSDDVNNNIKIIFPSPGVNHV